MKTVQEVLRETGLTDEQITALDPKVVTGVTTILSSANESLEKAEFTKRAVAQQYDTEIAPALDRWANESAALKAQVAFYKTQAEQAKTGGFIPNAAPNDPAPSRDATGKFVTGSNPVPGSPQYLSRDEGLQMLTASQYVLAEYMRLNNGAPPPDDLETLAREATAQRMNVRDYASKKYDFDTKRSAMKAAEQKKHDDALIADAVAANDKKWAEKVGNNPMIRQAETSRFSEINQAVKEGQRPDPLKMTRAERHNNTSRVIQKEIAETVQ